MPIYTATLTVPANTQEANPATVAIEFREKVVERVEVKFPPGCADMVNVIVQHGIKQVFPPETGMTIAGDGETVGFMEWWEAPETPCKLTFVGWSPGTSYDHKIICRIMTIPDKRLEIWELERKVLELEERFYREVVGV